MVTNLSRRGLLAQAAVLAGAALTPAWIPGIARANLPDYPFTLGVASGEPEPDGVVLWTRLAPRPLQADGGMTLDPVEVAWEVYEDEAARRRVLSDKALAIPDRAHSVHVEVRGLRPGREYWYRFTAGGHASAVARTRTAPAAGAPEQALRFAFASCQKYEAGFYHAHRQLAADAPDLVMFLGDYIYEQAATDRGVRRHPGPEAKDLAGYRIRYGAYKSEPNLQAAHAAAPWMVIWDDHEVENDYAGDRDASGAPEAFLRRRAAAYQAYYEHMPLRRRCQPVGPHMLLHRSLDWGDLAQFQLLDTRQHRPIMPRKIARRLIQECAERIDPSRSLLGAPQEDWLLEKLSTSKATWNILTQQYVMGEMRLPGGWFSGDGWDGYPASRQRIIDQWRGARTPNPVVLGGDMHTFVAGDLLERRGGAPVASEFAGSSLTSKGYDGAIVKMVMGANPHIKYGNTQRRGYGLVNMTRETFHVTFRAVDDAKAPTSQVRDLVRFVVENGEAGLKRA